MKIVAEMITEQRLKAVLDYCPETGQFKWKNKTKGIKPGATPGSTMKAGYLRIFIDGKSYQANRLAWLYMTGQWPKGDVDHRNGLKADNRWDNLRDVSRTINLQNSLTARSDSTTKLRGVHKNHHRFAARITASGHTKYLGTFDSPELAHAAYVEAKKIEHPEWNQ